ncbi:cytoplasmic tRNA 2-thiolation protein 2-like [Diadema antillarum]|uniref:cytoplasmic tRNA 2-thiolation protein 2-like n=1 Tax=Diadema antillarum TaxID=105358 RepID=UPI003A875E6C
MCDVQGDAVMPMEECRSARRKTTCMKCSAPAVVIARVKDSFCRNCFLAYVTHRFKATIGKARLIRDKEKVLLAFSGGQNSSAVAHLVKEGRSESQHKKFRFVPSLVYIDDGVVIGQTPAERSAVRTTISGLMKSYGFPAYVVPLEKILDLKPAREPISIGGGTEDGVVDDIAMVTEGVEEMNFDESASRRLLEILNSAKSLTAKEDLVRTLRLRLLAHVARQKGLTKIMLADNGTRLASRVLAGMAQGRGVTVPLEVGFADDRESDGVFVRPLREFPSREVTMYNHFSGVESVCVPTLTTKAGQYASINALTDDFINGLQVSFPSTVSTVFRTGEKLCSVAPSGGETDCVMCKAPLDTAVPSCSALESTRHSLSLRGSSEGSLPSNSLCGKGADGQPSTECCGQGDGSCHSNAKTISESELSQWLCYGCRITVREMKDVSLLPDYVISEAGRRQRSLQPLYF